jgi:hypothetical protein
MHSATADSSDHPARFPRVFRLRFESVNDGRQRIREALPAVVSMKEPDRQR